ncbi:MAG: tetratricopeptide repeat protein, partial [Planctomycetota bacterium]
MCKKIPSIGLIALLVFVAGGRSFADVSAQFEQAETFEKQGQYEQAEQIYRQIAADYPGSDDALTAQKNLTCLYIADDNQEQAGAAFGKLLDEFAEHEKLPGAIHKIAEQSHKLAKADKAILLCQHFMAIKPEQAIWLHMGMVISNIMLEDNDFAWAAVEKLLSDFSADRRCAEAIGQTAWTYRELKQYENARSLY